MKKLFFCFLLLVGSFVAFGSDSPPGKSPSANLEQVIAGKADNLVNLGTIDCEWAFIAPQESVVNVKTFSTAAPTLSFVREVATIRKFSVPAFVNYATLNARLSEPKEPSHRPYLYKQVDFRKNLQHSNFGYTLSAE